MRRSRERRDGGRRRGAGRRRQVSGTSVRGRRREIASSGATVMRELCGTGDFSFNLSAGVMGVHSSQLRSTWSELRDDGWAGS